MSLPETWSRLVEDVARMNSIEPLPKEFTPIEYLPENCEIPVELLTHIRAGASAFDTAARAIFQPQMTAEEGYHASPVLTTNHIEVNGDNNNNNNDNSEKTHLLKYEGSNFFEAYRAHAEAAAKMQSLTNLRGKKDFSLSAVGTIQSFGSAARLASGFLLPEYYAQKHRQPDFIPIILVPASVSSLLQLFNIREFLERGVYIDPQTLFVDAATGAVNIQESKPDAVIVTPGSFLDSGRYTVAYKVFRVVDDPKQVKNWQHVCACIVDGNEWQFRGWYPDEGSQVPVSELFQRVCGFLPYLEEDKLPKALQQWHVKPLPLTRRVVKSHSHILQASVFWEHLYTFLEAHSFFKLYTVPLD